MVFLWRYCLCCIMIHHNTTAFPVYKAYTEIALEPIGKVFWLKIWICIQADDLTNEKVPGNQRNMQSWLTGFAWITEVIEKLLSKAPSYFPKVVMLIGKQSHLLRLLESLLLKRKGSSSYATLTQLNMHLSFSNQCRDWLHNSFTKNNSSQNKLETIK